MPEPMSDLIVVLPGIGGSVLARHGRTVWSPRPGAALRAALSLGKSISSLTLHGDDHTRDDLGDGITATALLPDLHILPGLDWKIDGYGRLQRWLFERFDLTEGRNYLAFPYDWRRDIRVAARQLATVARAQLKAWRETSGNADARLILVGHSMGGLVARVFLEHHEGWKVTRRLVTFGTPYSGSVNALDFLVNGFRKGWGPFAIDLSTMLRSFTSVYQLLPSYRCLEVGTKWENLDALPALPNIDRDRLVDALTLHRGLRDAVKAADSAAGGPLLRYDIRPVIGDTQRTRWGARLVGQKIEVRYDRGPGEDGGDGTVPRVSAIPAELLEGWRNAGFFSEQHASLQNDSAVADHLTGVLRAVPIQLRDVFPAGENPLAVEVDDTTTAEPLRIRARPRDPVASLEATVIAVGDGSTRDVTLTQQQDGWWHADVPALASGDYRVRVGAAPTSVVTAIASVIDLNDLLRADDE